MPLLKHCVAVDWRAGKDRFYFFFKDTDTYSRFNISDQEVPAEYPSTVSGSWGTFDRHVKNLRFGFATTGLTLDKPMDTSDLDILWLFYYEGAIPMVCAYNQDTDSVLQYRAIKDTKWRLLLPYFDRIIAGTWWQVNRSSLFRFILNDGNSLYLDWDEVPRNPQRDYSDDKYDDNLFNPVATSIQTIRLDSITETTWPGLTPYKDRIITAVQKDRTLADNYYYIFLTNNQYLIYNIPKNALVSGPHPVNDESWPGLLRN
jgi:hypothetical protein